MYIGQSHAVRMSINNHTLSLLGGRGVQKPSHSGQSGYGAAAAHVGTVSLHIGLSSG